MQGLRQTSGARQRGIVWNFACSESSSLISGFLTWCHRAQHMSMPTSAANDFDVTSGGGTGRLWWTAVVHVCCGVDEQVVSKDTRQKSAILKRGSEARGVLPIPKQLFNLNNGRRSDES